MRRVIVQLDMGECRISGGWQLPDSSLWIDSETDTNGVRREKPLKGDAVTALQTWLERPLLRRLFLGGRIGNPVLRNDQVARIVQRRARLAGLGGDWVIGTAPHARGRRP